MVIINPDCNSAKHYVCDGQGWDTDLDGFVTCPCKCHAPIEEEPSPA